MISFDWSWLPGMGIFSGEYIMGTQNFCEKSKKKTTFLIERKYIWISSWTER